jgi:hypothetical protein
MMSNDIEVGVHIGHQIFREPVDRPARFSAVFCWCSRVPFTQHPDVSDDSRAKSPHSWHLARPSGLRCATTCRQHGGEVHRAGSCKMIFTPSNVEITWSALNSDDFMHLSKALVTATQHVMHVMIALDTINSEIRPQRHPTTQLSTKTSNTYSIPRTVLTVFRSFNSY